MVTRVVAAGGRRDEGGDAQEGEDRGQRHGYIFGYSWEFLLQRQKPGCIYSIIICSFYSFARLIPYKSHVETEPLDFCHISDK